MASLGLAALSLSFNDQQYRYDQGVYYSAYQGGYRAVYAPVGLFINQLPIGYTNVNLGDYDYFYYAGVFYVSEGNGFVVVVAPPGAVVYQLPAGCVEVTMGDITYLRYNNTLFQPIAINGEKAYEVVAEEDVDQ